MDYNNCKLCIHFIDNVDKPLCNKFYLLPINTCEGKSFEDKDK